MTSGLSEIPLAASQFLYVGACPKIATVLTKFEMSGHVWLVNHIKFPTSSRNGHTPSGASSLNSSRKTSFESGVLIPVVTPHCLTVLSVKDFSEIVNEPAILSRED